jgi:hypothetical protein
MVGPHKYVINPNGDIDGPCVPFFPRSAMLTFSDVTTLVQPNRRMIKMAVWLQMGAQTELPDK